jgi:hypothetical protein
MEHIRITHLGIESVAVSTSEYLIAKGRDVTARRDVHSQIIHLTVHDPGQMRSGSQGSTRVLNAVIQQSRIFRVVHLHTFTCERQASTDRELNN